MNSILFKGIQKPGSRTIFMPSNFGRHLTLAIASLIALLALSACQSSSDRVQNVTPISWPAPESSTSTATNLALQSIETNQIVAPVTEAPKHEEPKPEPPAEVPAPQPAFIEPEPEPSLALPHGLIPVDLWTSQSGLPNPQLI